MQQVRPSCLFSIGNVTATTITSIFPCFSLLHLFFLRYVQLRDLKILLCNLQAKSAKMVQVSTENFHIGYFSNTAASCSILLSHENWKLKKKHTLEKCIQVLNHNTRFIFINVKITLKVLLIDKNQYLKFFVALMNSMLNGT